MTKLTFICSLLFIFSTANDGWAARRTKINKIKPPKAIELTQLRTSKMGSQDISFAEGLATLIKLVKRNSFNPSIYEKLIRNKSAHFAPFKGWLSHTQKIYQTDKSAALVAICEQSVETTQKKSGVEQYFWRYGNRYCLHKLLNLLQTQAAHLSQDQLANSKSFSFVYRHLSYIFEHQDLRNSLRDLLGSFGEQNIASYKILSQTILELATQKDISLPPDIIGRMDNTIALTRYVQYKGFNQQEQRRILFQTLKKLRTTISYGIDDEQINKDNIAPYLNEMLTFFSVNKQVLPLRSSFKQLIYLGKLLRRESFFKESQQVFDLIKREGTKFPELRSEAIFEELWTLIRQKKFKKALELVNAYDLINGRETQSEKINFWVAYTLEKTGNLSYAQEKYNDLVRNSPLSFYSVFAQKRPGIKILYPNWLLDPNKEEQKRKTHQLTQAEFDNFHSRTVRSLCWSHIGNIPFFKQELGDFIHELESHKLSHNILSQLALALNNQKHYLSSFMTIYKGLDSELLDMDSDLIPILFPSPYSQEITKYQDNIDPSLITSLMRQESSFNSQANSHVGAVGLMQLMPATARSILERISTKELKDPQTNIKLGTAYLGKLLKKYDNNTIYALAAYNAGPNRVDRWKKKFLDDLNLLESIEEIPFNETRNYVKLILRNIYYYKFKNSNKPDSEKDQNLIFDLAIL